MYIAFVCNEYYWWLYNRLKPWLSISLCVWWCSSINIEQYVWRIWLVEVGVLQTNIRSLLDLVRWYDWMLPCYDHELCFNQLVINYRISINFHDNYAPKLIEFKHSCFLVLWACVILLEINMCFFIWWCTINIEQYVWRIWLVEVGVLQTNIRSLLPCYDHELCFNQWLNSIILTEKKITKIAWNCTDNVCFYIRKMIEFQSLSMRITHLIWLNSNIHVI